MVSSARGSRLRQIKDERAVQPQNAQVREWRSFGTRVRAAIVVACVAALALGGAHLAHATGFAQANNPTVTATVTAASADDGHGCADHAQKAPVEKACAVCVLHLSCLAIVWPEATVFVPIAHAPDTVPAATLLGRTVSPLLHPPDARA